MRIWSIAIVGAAAIAPCAPTLAAAPRPGTEIVVAPTAELSSRDVRTGDLFPIAVAGDVVQDGAVVVPRGTPGRARITWKTGKSVYGKSGKFEFDMVDLALPGGRVPIAGHYRVEGRGETGVTIAVTIVGGLAAGAVVIGHDAVAHPGVRWAARVVGAAGSAAPLRTESAAPVARFVGYTPPAADDPYRAGREAGLAARMASEGEL